VQRHLQQHPLDGPCAVIALGKAAGDMALGAIDALGEQLCDGLAVSKPDHLDRPALQQQGFQLFEGGHPVPDGASLDAGAALLAFIGRQPPERQLLFLISGGTSAVVEVLRPGLDLAQLQRVNEWLLGSGLGIGAMNRVRKSLSAIKGGGLLGYLSGRRVTGLLISDVPSDDPAVIGSGLLAADSDSAGAVVTTGLPDWLQSLVEGGNREPSTSGCTPELHIVASLHEAREAAATRARELGYATRVYHAFINADAENAGRRLALELLDALPGVYIWGGEPSVQLPAEPGRGGRNQHLALAAAGVIEGHEDICFLSAGTDGGDGPGVDAGALVDGATLARARREGFHSEAALAAADSGSLLDASGDLIHTGPTGTNVMDLMIGLRVEHERLTDRV
jgi:hydroxypyruvate reductase